MFRKVPLALFSLLLIPLLTAAQSEKPAYAIFDMHEHFRTGGKMGTYLRTAKKLGIEKTIFVPTGGSPDNEGFEQHMAALLQVKKRYPDRIIAFCTVNDEDPKAPEIFEKCLDEEGEGLKLLYGHPDFYDAPLNSEIAKKLFETANRRDVPIIVHVSIYRSKQMNEEFRSLMDLFPNTRLQFAHYCSTVYDGVHTELCEEYLDNYPNLYVDLSMGGGIPRYFKYFKNEMDREKVRSFILKYQDRLVYGTDMILSGRGVTTRAKWMRARILCDLHVLSEKVAGCPVITDIGSTTVPGLALPEEVLKKIFEENPKRFLKLAHARD